MATPPQTEQGTADLFGALSGAALALLRQSQRRHRADNGIDHRTNAGGAAVKNKQQELVPLRHPQQCRNDSVQAESVRPLREDEGQCVPAQAGAGRGHM